MIECHKCGFYDSEFEACTCSTLDKWYACPIESKKPENIKALEEYAEWVSKTESEKERMTDRKPDIPDISKIKCVDCRYNVDNVNEERPKMRFCAISGHALDIMDKGLPIWGCPIKDAYKTESEDKE